MEEKDSNELAYLAGLMDGEGTISIYKHWCNRKWWLSPEIIISNTNLALLEWIQTGYDGWIRPQKIYPGRKPMYVWKKQGKKAIDFIRLIEPFLRLKKAQAQILFDFGKTISTVSMGSKKLTEGTTEYRIKLKDNIRKLNKRGVQ